MPLLTKTKRRVARATGIPTTKSGRKRKANRLLGKYLGIPVLVVGAIALFGGEDDLAVAPANKVLIERKGAVSSRASTPPASAVRSNRGATKPQVVEDAQGRSWLKIDGKFYGPDGGGFVCEQLRGAEEWDCRKVNK